MKKMFSFKYNCIVSSKALMLVDCLNTFVHDCKLPERELVRKTVSVLSKKKKRWVVASIFRLATLHKCFSFRNASSRSKAMTFGSSHSL